MKAIILYKGKYGATRQYAEWIGSALQLPVFTAESVTLQELDKHNIIIAGGSVYMGKWQLQNWLRQHAYMLINKNLYFFIVCATPPDDKKGLDEIVKNNIPLFIRNSCTIHFLHGRMLFKNLSWQHRLLLRIGAWLTKDPVKKKKMLQDFDYVKKDNLSDMLKVIRTEQKSIFQPARV